MRSRISIVMAGAAAVALNLAVVSAGERAPYSGIVAFGTSLSDPGNAFALRGGANTPPDYLVDPLLIPSAPYARGGHHFSNGATWIEQVARPMGLAGSVRPAFAANVTGATNYAVGGARAYDDGVNVNLGDQVAAFLADHGGVAPVDALYSIEMGGNDLRDAIVAYQTGGLVAAQSILLQALTAIAVNVQTLHQAGARHFIVWLPPNVALTPALRTAAQANPGITLLGTFLTQGFNANLSNLLTQLSGLPGITIARLDSYTLLNQIVANPAAYGMTNVTQACVAPGDAPFFCQAPDEYLFWDGIHPTVAGHALIAHEARRLLAQ